MGGVADRFCYCGWPWRTVRTLPFFSILFFPIFLCPIFFSSICLAAQSPKELLAAGRADEAIETLDKEIRTAPSAEAYNLLCRARFETENWDEGIPACEKAVAMAPENGLYHLW